MRSVRVPAGPGIRDDSGVYPGYTVPMFYDPMISKLSVWANTREEAIAKLRRALGEYVVKGITTNIRYLKRILEHKEFVSGDYDTGFLERAKTDLLRPPDPALAPVALMAAALHAHERDKQLAQEQVFSRGSSDSRWKQQGRASALRRPLSLRTPCATLPPSPERRTPKRSTWSLCPAAATR